MNPLAKNKIKDSKAELENIFMQVPAMIAILKGQEYVYEFANPAYIELFGNSILIGKTLLETMPEVEGQGFIELLDNVYKTGETFIGKEMPMMLNRNGKPEKAYVNFSYQAFKNTKGETEGILVFAYEVTEQVNARKQIEEIAKENKKMASHLALATDSANVGTWSLDIKSQKLEWSDVHKRLWGYNEHAEDLTYQDWHNVIVQEDKEKAFQKIEEAKVNHTEYEAEYSIHRANDDVIRWMRSFGKYYYNDKGEAEMLTGISIDITEQKEAEEKIKEARGLLETTLQNVPSAIYHFDKAGNLLYLNELGARQIGYETIEEVLAEKDVSQLRKRAYETFTVLNEQGKPMSADQNSTALAYKTGQSSEVVSQLINRKTGASLWLLSRASPFYDHNGELIKVIASSTNITEQKEAEEAIRESEARFRTMAEATEVLIGVADEKSNVTYFNKAWVDLTGRPMEDLLKLGWADLLHPEDKDRVINIYLSAFAKQEDYTVEFRILDKNGEYRWLLAKVPARFYPDGTFAGYISACVDITEQKSLTEELERKIKERTKELNTKNTDLARSNAELAAFNYIASHDLQEPLRSISNYVGLLAKKNNRQDEETNEFMNYIIGSAARMSLLINDLLEYARIGKDKTISEIDCDKLLHEVLKDMAASIKESGAKIHSEKLPIIKGYVQIKSIFQNLLSNAIKFRKNGTHPVINITAQDKEKEWLFGIKDNGIGIEKTYYDKLFVIFQRLHTRVEYPGTGIGLANCKKIVELHGGTIWVESELGKGSAFYFTIPKTIIS